MSDSLSRIGHYPLYKIFIKIKLPFRAGFCFSFVSSSFSDYVRFNFSTPTLPVFVYFIVSLLFPTPKFYHNEFVLSRFIFYLVLESFPPK